jgi:hypothetical protein
MNISRETGSRAVIIGRWGEMVVQTVVRQLVSRTALAVPHLVLGTPAGLNCESGNQLRQKIAMRYPGSKK